MDTGSTSERPAISGWSGANSPGALALAAAAHLLAHLLHGVGGQRACRNSAAAIVSPRPESTQTAPPVAAASARTTSSRPFSSSTSRSSRLWIAMPRWSTSYCSFTSLVNARSVSAMNGSS